MKNYIFVLCMIGLTACTTVPEKQTVIYVDKPIPFYIVPKPPEVTRPDFEIDKLTEEQKNNPSQNAGAISRAVRITLEQYKQYSEILEEIIDKYDELADKSKEKLDALKSDSSTENGPQAAAKPVEDLTTNFAINNLKHIQEVYSTEKDFDEMEKKFNDIQGE